jgi:hypothetical protein
MLIIRTCQHGISRLHTFYPIRLYVQRLTNDFRAVTQFLDVDRDIGKSRQAVSKHLVPRAHYRTALKVKRLLTSAQLQFKTEMGRLSKSGRLRSWVGRGCRCVRRYCAVRAADGSSSISDYPSSRILFYLSRTTVLKTSIHSFLYSFIHLSIHSFDKILCFILFTSHDLSLPSINSCKVHYSK